MNFVLILFCIRKKEIIHHILLPIKDTKMQQDPHIQKRDLPYNNASALVGTILAQRKTQILQDLFWS